MKPPKRVWPSADQAMDTHSGSRELTPTSTKSGLSSSTIDLAKSVTGQSGRGVTYLDSRSKILTQDAVAAHNQYRLGEKTRALTMSPASRE